MKNSTWAILAALWISGVVIMIIALTDVLPDNSLQENKLIVVLAFMALSGFIRRYYRKSFKNISND